MSQTEVSPWDDDADPGEFPAYTYTPGVTPHPVTDPRGHSFGRDESAPAIFDPERWSECEPFVRGLRLFNRGFYWEAHEEWEAAWHSVGRSGPLADFLKGLIKWAAAGVKVREGRPNGVTRHLERAGELLSSARRQLETREFAGQSLEAILAAIRQSIESPIPAEGETDGRPIVYWPFRLTEAEN
jgi:uncharacterized protein